MSRYLLGSILLIACAFTAMAQPPISVSPEPTGGYRINGRYFSTITPGSYNIDGIQYILLPPGQQVSKPESKKAETKKDVPAPKDEPPPAPKEPEHRPVAAAPPPSVPGTKTPSKDDIIKSIENNTTLPDSVKKDILSGLKGQPEQPTQESKKEEPKKAPTAKEPPSFSIVTPSGKIDSPLPPPRESTKVEPTKEPEAFDLLKALKKKSTTPAVKADTDETPPLKAANPPRPEEPKKDFLLLPMGVAEEADPAGVEVPATDIGVSVGSKIDYAKSWDTSKPVPYGKLIQFWVKPVAKRPDKLKSVAYTWTVLPKEDIILWPDTTRIVLSSGNKPQNYVVFLTASYVYLDGDKIIQRVNQAITMVQVGEDGATVGGTDGEFKPPPPTLTGVPKTVYEWIALIGRNSKYNEAGIKAHAKQLAASFRDIAKKVDNGQLTDINDIISTTRVENDKILKELRTEWLPWFTKMSDLLRAGFRDNTIRTPQHYAQLWKEIADGLDAFAK